MLPRWKLYLVPLIGFVVALSMHLWHLGQPAEIAGDEVYFVNDAWDYVTGQVYHEAHPPLGMEQMGAVFTAFGFTPLTWRITNAVEGALLVPLLWWLVWRLTKSPRAAHVAAVLTVLDGFLLTESRLGVINIPYILYSFAGLACVLKALQQRRRVGWLLAAGTLFGAALSVKWLAGPFIAISVLLWFWPKLFGQERHPKQPLWIWSVSIGAFLFIPIAVYLFVWHIHFAWLGIPDTTWRANWEQWYFHTHVTTTDIYHQPWWGWLMAWQPFLYYAKNVGDKISAIWSMPNPWIWWTGVLFFVYNLIRGWKQGLLRGLNIFLLATWLPFAFVKRELFIYTAIPFDLLLIILLAVYSEKFWNKKKLVWGYVAVALLVFLWFWPWYTNIPLSSSQQRLRQWLPNWRVKTVIATPLLQATPRSE